MDRVRLTAAMCGQFSPTLACTGATRSGGRWHGCAPVKAPSVVWVDGVQHAAKGCQEHGAQGNLAHGEEHAQHEMNIEAALETVADKASCTSCDRQDAKKKHCYRREAIDWALHGAPKDEQAQCSEHVYACQHSHGCSRTLSTAFATASSRHVHDQSHTGSWREMAGVLL